MSTKNKKFPSFFSPKNAPFSPRFMSKIHKYNCFVPPCFPDKLITRFALRRA